jgi:hypothetical protein
LGRGRWRKGRGEGWMGGVQGGRVPAQSWARGAAAGRGRPAASARPLPALVAAATAGCGRRRSPQPPTCSSSVLPTLKARHSSCAKPWRDARRHAALDSVSRPGSIGASSSESSGVARARASRGRRRGGTPGCPGRSGGGGAPRHCRPRWRHTAAPGGARRGAAACAVLAGAPPGGQACLGTLPSGMAHVGVAPRPARRAGICRAAALPARRAPRGVAPRKRSSVPDATSCRDPGASGRRRGRGEGRVRRGGEEAGGEGGWGGWIGWAVQCDCAQGCGPRDAPAKGPTAPRSTRKSPSHHAPTSAGASALGPGRCAVVPPARPRRGGSGATAGAAGAESGAAQPLHAGGSGRGGPAARPPGSNGFLLLPPRPRRRQGACVAGRGRAQGLGPAAAVGRPNVPKPAPAQAAPALAPAAGRLHDLHGPRQV